MFQFRLAGLNLEVNLVYSIVYLFRMDTVDSKILNKYGIFVHRKNPELVYIKSSKRALESLSKDQEEMRKLKSIKLFGRFKFQFIDINFNFN